MFRHYKFIDYATQGYLLFVALLILLFHNGTVPAWTWLVGAHGLCLGGVHWLVSRGAREGAGRVLTFLRHFYPVLLYTAMFRETGSLNRMFFVEYLDPLVIGWEQAWFGTQPSMWFMEKLPHLVVSELFYMAYFSYYVMIVGVGLALFLRNRPAFFHYVSVVSFVFYVCYTIYIFLPVVGPRLFMREIEGYALPQAVWSLAPTHEYPPAVQAGPFFNIMAVIYEIFEAPGAALPSSHVAIALCTLYFSFRYLPRIRHLHLVMALLLCVSTIYCRYHYVVDVMAGVLTAAVLLPLANWLYWKFEGATARSAQPEAVPALE
ncbi:MAG: phosphatase PAP2 family protein [Verrucomicrobia bacterium]|jgi:membrane-associated phospholipid phosphatase|nr:phosphatase PAP2 family protein [Verrucomicrobiota bacterium]